MASFRLRLPLIFAAFLALAAALEAAPRPTGYPVLPGIWKLHGNDANTSQEDLEPLRQIIGKAQVVGLGETVHTSGGFYKMKHRTFRFLVEKMGFRVLAFESNWTDADRVTQYVQTCGDDPVQSLRSLAGVWNSTEVADLVEWMCEWNRAHRNPKDRVHFFGFDIQQPEDDGPALIAFLRRTGVAEGDPWIDGIRSCEGVVTSLFPVPDEPHARCLQALDAIAAHFQRNARQLTRQTSKKDFETARLQLVGLRAWQEEVYYAERDDARSSEVRDQGMAYAFQALRAQRFPRSKVAVWAHNSHVSRGLHPVYGSRTLGMFLSQALKRNYVNFGLIAYEIDMDWPSERCGRRPIVLEGSVELALHNLGHDALLVDLDFPGTSNPYLPPGEYSFGGDKRLDPRAHFDGLLYLEQSPKMNPTAWAPCQ